MLSEHAPYSSAYSMFSRIISQCRFLLFISLFLSFLSYLRLHQQIDGNSPMHGVRNDHHRDYTEGRRRHEFMFLMLHGVRKSGSRGYTASRSSDSRGYTALGAQVAKGYTAYERLRVTNSTWRHQFARCFLNYDIQVIVGVFGV